MREILFKGKRVDNREWVEGYLYRLSETLNPFIMIPNRFGEAYEVDFETVCQYTELTDKNGKKIFEGDIIKAGGNLVVQWNEKYASWCLSKQGWMYSHFFGEAVMPEDCEVIGNIFDNPDLLTISYTDSD